MGLGGGTQWISLGVGLGDLESLFQPMIVENRGFVFNLPVCDEAGLNRW